MIMVSFIDVIYLLTLFYHVIELGPPNVESKYSIMDFTASLPESRKDFNLLATQLIDAIKSLKNEGDKTEDLQLKTELRKQHSRLCAKLIAVMDRLEKWDAVKSAFNSGDDETHSAAPLAPDWAIGSHIRQGLNVRMYDVNKVDMSNSLMTWILRVLKFVDFEPGSTKVKEMLERLALTPQFQEMGSLVRKARKRHLTDLQESRTDTLIMECRELFFKEGARIRITTYKQKIRRPFEKLVSHSLCKGKT